MIKGGGIKTILRRNEKAFNILTEIKMSQETAFDR
jgi:hypothetical protein